MRNYTNDLKLELFTLFCQLNPVFEKIAYALEKLVVQMFSIVIKYLHSWEIVLAVVE